MKRAFLLVSLMSAILLTLPLGVGAIVIDDFNDNSTNTSLWQLVSAGGPTASEINQRLEITVPADSQAGLGTEFAAGYYSTRQLRGDFDIQIDYALLDWPQMNGVRLGMEIVLPGKPWHSYDNKNISRVSLGPGDSPRYEAYAHHFSRYVGGVTQTADTSGQLRLVRNGGTLSMYYMGSGGWVALSSGSITTSDVGFGFYAWSENAYFAGQTVRAAFDNFSLNSGELIPPVPEPSSLLTLLCGLGSIGGIAWRRRR